MPRLRILQAVAVEAVHEERSGLRSAVVPDTAWYRHHGDDTQKAEAREDGCKDELKEDHANLAWEGEEGRNSAVRRALEAVLDDDRSTIRSKIARGREMAHTQV